MIYNPNLVAFLTGATEWQASLKGALPWFQFIVLCWIADLLRGIARRRS